MRLSDRLIHALAFAAATIDLRPRRSGEPRPARPELDPAARCLRAVPAALALDRREDGTGDLWTHREPVPSVGLLFGLSAEALLLQLLGDARAPAAGRDAGDLPTESSRGLLGPITLPGKGVEVAAGAALALRMRDEPRVVVHFDEVGGTSSGDWHEGLNFAAVSRAPLVLVVRNDVGDSARHTALRSLVRKGPAYGVPVTSVPGSDPAAILDAVAESVERARSRRGTQMVELAESDASPPLHDRLGVDEADFVEEVSRRTAEYRTLRDDLLADRRDDLDAVRGPIASGTPPSIPWYRTAELRPR